MNSKQTKWFSGYYVIILIICLLVGLFIWFIFRATLSELEQQKEDAYKKKPTSFVERASEFPSPHLFISIN